MSTVSRVSGFRVSGIGQGNATPRTRNPIPATRVPAEARLIGCFGQLTRRAGIKDAVWALDILKYLYDNLYLIVVGDGPERDQVQRFARDIEIVDRVSFLGQRHDVPELLRLVDVVWLPGREDGARTIALEAMRARRPIVAARETGLSDLVVDGETGFLVPSGDKPALARQTRRLLDDTDLRQRMGEAGRRQVAGHCRPGATELSL